MNDEDDRKRKCYIIVVIALLIAFLSFSLAQNAQNTADNNANITNIWEMAINNTNLAPAVVDHPGTGERVTGVTYYANDYPLQLLVFAHAASISQVAGVDVYINGTLVAPQAGRPLGGAEETNRSVVVNIPKFAAYKVNFTNYHHYEWREYPILSGRNGTLSVNQTFITNGSNYNASYFPYENSTRNVTFGIGNFSFVSPDGNSSVQIQNASVGAIVLHQERSPSFGETRNATLSIDGVIGMKTYDDTTKTNATYLLSDIEHLFKIDNTIIATINKNGMDLGTHDLNASYINASNNIEANGTIRATNQKIPSGGKGMEVVWDGTFGHMRAYDRTNNVYLPSAVAGESVWLSGVNNSATDLCEMIRGNLINNIHILCNGNVAIGSSITNPQTRLEVESGMRINESNGWVQPTTGEGVELVSVSNSGFVLSFNRSTSTYRPLYVRGKNVIMDQGNLTISPPNKPSCITMNSPDGTAYRLTVANGGTLSIVAGTCG